MLGFIILLRFFIIITLCIRGSHSELNIFLPVPPFCPLLASSSPSDQWSVSSSLPHFSTPSLLLHVPRLDDHSIAYGFSIPLVTLVS